MSQMIESALEIERASQIELASYIEATSHIEAASQIETTAQAEVASHFEAVYMLKIIRLQYSLMPPLEKLHRSCLTRIETDSQVQYYKGCGFLIYTWFESVSKIQAASHIYALHRIELWKKKRGMNHKWERVVLPSYLPPIDLYMKHHLRLTHLFTHSG